MELMSAVGCIQQQHSIIRPKAGNGNATPPLPANVIHIVICMNIISNLNIDCICWSWRQAEGSGWQIIDFTTNSINNGVNWYCRAGINSSTLYSHRTECSHFLLVLLHLVDSPTAWQLVGFFFAKIFSGFWLFDMLLISCFILFMLLFIFPGLYGNDDFHNGLLQAFSSGKQVEGLVLSLKRQVCTWDWNWINTWEWQRYSCGVVFKNPG